MEITRVVVKINGLATDEVTLHTDLPSPMPKVTDHPMAAMFHVEHGKGVGYALTQFPGLPVETVDANTGARKRVRSTFPAEPDGWYGEPIEED
jgi:hypothetical protein